MTIVKANSIEMVPVEKLVNHPRNNNIHTPEQIERLTKIIKHSGFRDPLIVSKRSGYIVCGHARVEAAKKLGLTELPVCFEEFESEAEEYQHLTASNEIARWATIDTTKLDTDLKDINFDLDIELLGLEDFALTPVEQLDESKQDDVPDVVENPVTKRGDVWLLGDHRILCGDSTMIDDVDKLMKGEKADMVFTDPPYGIDEPCDRRQHVKTFKNQGVAEKGSYHQIIGDKTTDTALDVINLCEGLKIDTQIFWGGNYYDLPPSACWIVWDKRVEENQVDINSDCELAYVRHKSKKSVRIFRHLWKGMIKASERDQKRVHPTQKPIALAEWCFENYGKPNGILDLFLGSGSTLIACEKTNRKCYGMELDEKYCDVIIKRFQDFTKKEAVLESSGQTYNSLLESK